jgi:hypothetical protein
MTKKRNTVQRNSEVIAHIPGGSGEGAFAIREVLPREICRCRAAACR